MVQYVSIITESAKLAINFENIFVYTWASLVALGKTLLAFALLHFVLQGQICMLLQISLDFLLLHSSPL